MRGRSQFSAAILSQGTRASRSTLHSLAPLVPGATGGRRAACMFAVPRGGRQVGLSDAPGFCFAHLGWCVSLALAAGLTGWA